MLEERRRQRRILFPFKVQIKVDGDELNDVFHTENISTGGLRIISQRKLERNTLVGVYFETNKGPIQCQGKVAWFLEIKPAEANAAMLYDIGVEFISLTSEQKIILESVLGNLRDRNIV